MKNIEKLFEYSEKDDPKLDYCLWSYESLISSENKFRSINLLYHSFAVAGVENELLDLCNALRHELGAWRTVWGIKNVEGCLSWEFYFYDYNRMQREISISKAINVFLDFTNCNLKINEDCMYFMFSIDVDNALVTGRRDLSEINVYLGDVSNHVSAGICYLLNENGLRMDNLYHFFDAREDMDQIADKVYSSLHLTLSDFEINKILMPEFIDCQTIVVANKKHNDGIYFSRIDVEQLSNFLEMMQYPDDLKNFVQDNRNKLDHMLYDIGIDYRMEQGEIKLLKSSYYGVF